MYSSVLHQEFFFSDLFQLFLTRLAVISQLEPEDSVSWLILTSNSIQNNAIGLTDKKIIYVHIGVSIGEGIERQNSP